MEGIREATGSGKDGDWGGIKQAIGQGGQRALDKRSIRMGKEGGHQTNNRSVRGERTKTKDLQIVRANKFINI